MRITNKIMQNNSLSNINTTKVTEDYLSTQMSTGKKNVRPSDDPVTAIRALRLSTSVTEITQYYENNIPDASSWLDTTADALDQETDVINSMITQYNNGVNQYMTSSDREVILEQLESLAEEVYATGNADYAGRYVFTGYRTDTSLTFTEDTSETYRITEQLDASDLKTGTHVDTSFTNSSGTEIDLTDLTDGTQSDYTDVTEQDISNNTYYRIRLSYDNCDAGTSYMPSITSTDSTGATVTIADETGSGTYTVTSALSTDIPSPYDNIGDDDVIYLSDTGELLLGSNVYETLAGMTDDASTDDIDEGEFRVTYEKTSFEEGDLRPEHYFYCQTAGDDGTVGSSDDIIYNPSYLTGTTEKQVIEYDVGVNQRLQVNTTADEAFDPGIVREIDDLIDALNNLTDIEDVVNTLTDALAATTDETEQATIQQQLDAANKAYSYAQENVKTMFENGITVMQSYLEATALASTDCGARASRLDLIENRLSNQKTTFENLQSDNEDVDIAVTAVQLESAELTYEASLQATAKILKTNLMDYI